jgi:hypothetical protein
LRPFRLPKLAHRRYLDAKPNAPPAFTAVVRLAVAEDRSQCRDRASNDLTFVKSEAAFELPKSRRRAVAYQPRKQQLSIAYTGARQAVPTGEAHRLPKSAAYVSTLSGEVKAMASKNAMAQAHPRHTLPGCARAGMKRDGTGARADLPL